MGSAPDPELYVFKGQPDGNGPISGLANIGNTMYGTTPYGGATNQGALYSVTTGGSEAIIHSFGATTDDGTDPVSAVTIVNGTLYRTTQRGGPGQGTLFSMTPSGTYTILHDFDAGTDTCAFPYTALTYVSSQKALYGVSTGGNGSGCIFKLSLAGKHPKESTFYSFGDETDGYPSALVYYKGAFYATAPGSDAGQVIKVTLSGKETIIHTFSATGKGFAQGFAPESALTVVGDAFFGSTAAGGTSQEGACGDQGCGTLFKMTPDGKETVLHRFVVSSKGPEGEAPDSPMTDIGGTLYGTTPSSGSGAYQGTIYALTPAGKYRLFFSFQPGTLPGYPTGPQAPVIAVGKELYGTTQYDNGSTGYGTVYGVPIGSH